MNYLKYRVLLIAIGGTAIFLSSVERVSADEPKMGLVGNWELDLDKTGEVFGKKFDAEKIKQLKNLGLNVRFDFLANGTLVSTMTLGEKSKSKEGTWKLLKTDAVKSSMSIEITAGDENIKENIAIEFLKPDLIVVKHEANSFVLRRIKIGSKKSK